MRVLFPFGFAVGCALSLGTLSACGPDKKPVKDGEGDTDGDDRRPGGNVDPTNPKAADTSAAASSDEPKKDECVGFEVDDLEALLNKASCEFKGTAKAEDLTGKLEIKLSPMPPRAKPGEKIDIMVTFVNKTKDVLPLYFTIDPTPRFEVEAFDAKNKRVDMPAGNPPPPPKGITVPPTADGKTARITLAANGTAKIHVPYLASRMKWAPEKVRSTPPERGYPRSPAGGLRKGKYTIRVVTPLAFVVEGMDKEISAPKVSLEVQ